MQSCGVFEFRYSWREPSISWRRTTFSFFPSPLLYFPTLNAWELRSIPLNVLGVNIDLLEVLFLSRLILPSWDKVAQGTRIQLERAQKGGGIIGGRMVRAIGVGKNEEGGWTLYFKSSYGSLPARSSPVCVVCDRPAPHPCPTTVSSLLCSGHGAVPAQCPWALKELLREVLQGSCFLDGH